MKIQRFDPPAFLDDFESIPGQLEAWNQIVSTFFDEAVQGVEQLLGPGKSQFYNPLKTETDEPFIPAKIPWPGFPQRLANKHPDEPEAAWKAAEGLVSAWLDEAETIQVKFRPQDEYLEWFTTRDASGKVTKVTFTCEPPEYWTALAHADRKRLLALYRELVSSEVQIEDLFFPGGTYNPFNKWNTELGVVHLSHPSNSLGAEINLASRATVLRQKDGVTLTDYNELICCAQYGEPLRASDPRIGGDVNALARKGASITLQNPVGLYIDRLDTDGWTKQDGSPVGNYWKPVRGRHGLIVRAEYEVPPGEGFVVGDILIGGVPIRYGGQIAEHITMQLTGIACRVGQSHNPPVPCRPGTPDGCTTGAEPESAPGTVGGRGRVFPGRPPRG